MWNQERTLIGIKMIFYMIKIVQFSTDYMIVNGRRVEEDFNENNRNMWFRWFGKGNIRFS